MMLKKSAMKLKKESAMMMKKAAMKMKKVSAMKIKHKKQGNLYQKQFFNLKTNKYDLFILQDQYNDWQP